MQSKVTQILVCILVSLALASCGSAEKNRENQRTDPKKIDPDSNSSSGSLFNNIRSSRPRGELYKPTPVKPLVLPEDILNTSSSSVKQEVTSYNPETFRVLPPIKDARIVSEGDRLWLEVDSDVQLVWEAIVEYWAISGIDLVNHNPEAGLMETEWVRSARVIDEDVPEALRLVRTVLGALTRSGEAMHRYRLRFARMGEDKTAVYVSHRSVERKEISRGKQVSDFEWVELESDPEKIAEFLEALVALFENGQGKTS
ncbi:MAG: outer membrane protein assembly factor BamC [Gammaproteobacteria bacterium]|nr:outer membrane protein assembly factor BamC [Gammaproteobacteria bacterium]